MAADVQITGVTCELFSMLENTSASFKAPYCIIHITDKIDPSYKQNGIILGHMLERKVVQGDYSGLGRRGNIFPANVHT